MIKEVTKVL